MSNRANQANRALNWARDVLRFLACTEQYWGHIDLSPPFGTYVGRDVVTLECRPEIGRVDVIFGTYVTYAHEESFERDMVRLLFDQLAEFGADVLVPHPALETKGIENLVAIPSAALDIRRPNIYMFASDGWLTMPSIYETATVAMSPYSTWHMNVAGSRTVTREAAQPVPALRDALSRLLSDTLCNWMQNPYPLPVQLTREQLSALEHTVPTELSSSIDTRCGPFNVDYMAVEVSSALVAAHIAYFAVSVASATAMLRSGMPVTLGELFPSPLHVVEYVAEAPSTPPMLGVFSTPSLVTLVMLRRDYRVTVLTWSSRGRVHDPWDIGKMPAYYYWNNAIMFASLGVKHIA